IEVGQRIGNQRNNSQFLLPNPQGTSRFEFNAKQPLFRGAGRAVNESQIVLARLGANAADGRVQFEMQQHLRDVAIAYWELYEARAQWLQRQRNFQQAEEILQTLLAREQEDASRRQVLRTAVEVKKRMADLARSRANILDAQSRLQLLVRTPLLIDNVTREWTPQDVPFQNHQEIHTQPFVVDAMENRRDISEAMAELRAAQVRVGVSKNALLPRLDLLVSTYAAGLDGGDVIVDALDDQIRRGRPSFSAGFLFDVPLGRHAAKADVRRRNWQLNQAIHRFEQATATAMTETQIAVRDVNTSHAELMALIASVDAANREVAYLEDRFRSLPMPGDSSVLLLENLLSAQQRQLREELAVASSTVSYAIAWVRLRFVTGTLFCDHGKIPHSQISSPAAHDFAVQPVPGGTR
ncbi:MAG: TolC family protein, partial [Planctomycetota bacterium]